MKKIWFILIPIIIFTFVVFAYYWYRYPAMFRILQDDSLSEAEVASLVESKKSQDLNLLVAYFSYTGTTQGIAEEIRFKIGADLFLSLIHIYILFFTSKLGCEYAIIRWHS